MVQAMLAIIVKSSRILTESLTRVVTKPNTMKAIKRFIIMGAIASAAMLFSSPANALGFKFNHDFDFDFDHPQFEWPDHEWPGISQPPGQQGEPDCLLTCLDELNIDLENISWNNWRETLEGLKDVNWDQLFNCLKDCRTDRPCDVPDGGATLALMGLGLLGVVGLRQRFTQR